jgi:hypothetical protein
MDHANLPQCERPRKRGRPLTYEEKWRVQHVFETLEKEKNAEAIIQRHEPYSLTSKYTGVARSLVATIPKAVRPTGHVPVSPPLGHRHQPTPIPFAAEGRRRERVFAKHRPGTICQAKQVHALLKEAGGLDVPARTVQRHVKRRGFCWLGTKNRPRSLRENAAVRQQRPAYLYAIRRQRQRPPEERYQGVYVAERFLPPQHGGQSSWFSDQDFVERMRGQGRRGCCRPARQETALLAGTFLACEATHSKGDDPAQLDGDICPHWCTAQ